MRQQGFSAKSHLVTDDVSDRPPSRAREVSARARTSSWPRYWALEPPTTIFSFSF